MLINPPSSAWLTKNPNDVYKHHHRITMENQYTRTESSTKEWISLILGKITIKYFCKDIIYDLYNSVIHSSGKNPNDAKSNNIRK